jgi:FkbM family methyltransferase
MASKIKGLVREFGFIDGIKFYFQLKANKSVLLKSSEKKIEIFLRNNGTDKGIFGQVFIARQYQIPYSFEAKTIIDAGANIGMAALYFADRFPNATIVALEPDKENFKIAHKNTRHNERIKLEQKGIWNKNTFLEIVDTTASVDSFMVKEVESKTADSIEATTIDAIRQQEGWTTIDILKVDIEGAEKELFLSNYENWLPLTKVILIEIHDHMKKGSSKAVFHAISQYNFSFSMRHENLVFVNEDL